MTGNFQRNKRNAFATGCGFIVVPRRASSWQKGLKPSAAIQEQAYDMRWVMGDVRVSPNGAEAQSPGLPAWRATLGRRGERSTTPTGLRQRRRDVPQPRWGCLRSARVPRVGPGRANLGL